MVQSFLRRFAASVVAVSSLAMAAPMVAAPSVYPTGATIYDPGQAENGYTVLSLLGTRAVIVIDMNGRVVKRWDDYNVSAGGPARILPGGIAVASAGMFPGHLETSALIARDFDGNELWRFDRAEEITIEGESQWSARQHHDWQLSNFPAGYYSPDYTPGLDAERTLILAHSNLTDSAIADVVLEDDRIYEVDAQGDIVWDWRASDHIDDLGFDVAERNAIRRGGARDNFDWFHINSATYLGPNQWYDAGDERFHPDNVIISSRQTSIVAIIDRAGEIVWQMGPDYADSLATNALGQIVGQHHAHFIPQGLPGAGNLLIFDNGGSGGYGDPTALSPNGQTQYRRHNSRVLEINPVTLELVWSYAAGNFFSFNISGMQRLENGNTLITEGAPGRVFEVTEEGEIVWEYMQAPSTSGPFPSPAIYRAYRLPYEWIPQLERPEEVALDVPAPGSFHVPGTASVLGQ